MHEQILRKLKCRDSNSFNLLVLRHSTTPMGYRLPDAAGGTRSAAARIGALSRDLVPMREEDAPGGAGQASR
jgi:hypothetical protein